MESLRKLIITAAVLCAAAGALFADTKGDEIMRKVYDKDSPKTSKSVAIMALKDGKKINKRKLKMYAKDTEEGNNSFIEFLYPADVKGTKFLTIGNEDGDDDQRLWLPALGKIRKISSSGKGGKFMGSDISYYDMEDRSFDDATYKYIGEDSLTFTKDGKKKSRSCWVVEATPTDEDAPYSKSKLWICKDDYSIYKTEVFDADKKNLLKTLYIPETKTIKGYVIPIKTVVVMAEGGHQTLLFVDKSALEVNVSIDDDVFNPKNLER